MTMVQVCSVSSTDLRITVSYGGGRLSVTVIGHVDGPPERDLFAATMDRVRQEARLLRVNEVVLDVCDLRFLDTASLRQLIAWIADLPKLSEDARYKVRVIHSGGAWQERTLPMLRALAAGLVTLEGTTPLSRS